MKQKVVFCEMEVVNIPKRGTDHTWQLVRYKGDGALYLKCKCGYYYNCGRSRREEDGTLSLKQYPTIFYPYCPYCGARKKWRSENVNKIDKYEFE